MWGLIMHKHKHEKKMQAKPEAREPIISRKLSERFDIPQDIIAKAPIIFAYGNNRLCIDNYRNIIEYTEELIKVQTKQKKIYIKGSRLVIAYFREDEMCVLGNISSIEYH